MKKFFLFLTAVLLIAVALGTTYYIKIQNGPEKEISITDAFNFSGAKMITNELYFFVRASDGFNTMDSLVTVCKEVLKELEITNYDERSNSTDSLMKTEYSGIDKDGIKISAMASIVGNKAAASEDRYITVNATGTETVNALDLRQKIEKVFTAYQLKAEVNSCITGTYDGNLADSQLEAICRKVLNDSSAKKVDSLRQSNVISVSAFSPMLKDKLSVGGKNVNLSLAIRYNKLENKTYLWVATPVVNTEY